MVPSRTKLTDTFIHTQHDRLNREITSLRARAAKEKQLNRRVEMNLQVKRLESRLAEAAKAL